MQKIKIEDLRTKHKNIVSIDFGTTTSVVAYMHEKQYKFLTHFTRDKTNSTIVTMPTVIGFKDSQHYIGHQLQELNLSSAQIIKSIKRTIGMSADEILSNINLAKAFGEIMVMPKENSGHARPAFNFNGQMVSNLCCVSMIFMHLKQLLLDQVRSYEEACVQNTSVVQPANNSIKINDTSSQDYNEEEPIYTILTAPVYFDELAKAELKLCAQKAGLLVIKTLPEPVAAIYAHDLSLGTYLVLDLGGGTYDISIVQLRESIYRVITNDGDRYFGGDDIDLAIAEHIALKYWPHNTTSLDRNLLDIARHIKEWMSQNNGKNYSNFHSNIGIKSLSLSQEPPLLIELLYEDYIKILSPFLNHAIEIMMKAVNKAAKILASNSEFKLDGIVLVGGATKMPQLQDAIKNALPNTTHYNDIDPETSVALGALKHAYATQKLMQVAPISLGIEVMGGAVEQIIARNTQLPVVVRKIFSNYSEEQTKVRINILEGERELSSHCKSLGVFEIPILPSRPGTARIEVIFSLDFDANLIVSANVNGGESTFFSYKPFQNFDVHKEIEEALMHQESDFQAKELANETVKAQMILHNLKALAATKNSPNDNIRLNINQLEKALQNKCLREIKAAMQIISNDMMVN